MTDPQRRLDHETAELIERLEPVAADLERFGLTVGHPLSDAAGIFTIALAVALRPLDDDDVKGILDRLDDALDRARTTWSASQEAKNSTLFFRRMLEIAILQLFPEK